MKCYIRKAPGRPPKGIKKNVQQAGLTYFPSYIPTSLHCQVYIQELQVVAKTSCKKRNVNSLHPGLLPAGYSELKQEVLLKCMT